MHLASFSCTLAALLLAGCAAPRPVLYPNDKYVQVGKRAAEHEIDECIALAKDFEAQPPNQPAEAGVDVLEDTTVGAATGAAVGAVVGNVGRGAAAGAAAGAAGGTVRAIFRGLRDEGPYTSYHLFVERCLSDRGYDLVGWR